MTQPPIDPPGATGHPPPGVSLILQTTAGALLHVLIVFAVYLLLRGHNHPGGGFIAGLLTAVALVLEYLAFGPRSMRRVLVFSPLALIGAGLSVALATGLASLLFGRAFLTHTFGHVFVPLLGDLELASAAVFDFGIYLLVIGNVLTAIDMLAAESE